MWIWSGLDCFQREVFFFFFCLSSPIEKIAWGVGAENSRPQRRRSAVLCQPKCGYGPHPGISQEKEKYSRPSARLQRGCVCPPLATQLHKRHRYQHQYTHDGRNSGTHVSQVKWHLSLNTLCLHNLMNTKLPQQNWVGWRAGKVQGQKHKREWCQGSDWVQGLWGPQTVWV